MWPNVQLLQINSISSLKVKLDPTEPDTLRPRGDATPAANQTAAEGPDLQIQYVHLLSQGRFVPTGQAGR